MHHEGDGSLMGLAPTINIPRCVIETRLLTNLMFLLVPDYVSVKLASFELFFLNPDIFLGVEYFFKDNLCSWFLNCSDIHKYARKYSYEYAFLMQQS